MTFVEWGTIAAFHGVDRTYIRIPVPQGIGLVAQNAKLSNSIRQRDSCPVPPVTVFANPFPDKPGLNGMTRAMLESAAGSTLPRDKGEDGT